jgi:hypothetical protein
MLPHSLVSPEFAHSRAKLRCDCSGCGSFVVPLQAEFRRPLFLKTNDEVNAYWDHLDGGHTSATAATLEATRCSMRMPRCLPASQLLKIQFNGVVELPTYIDVGASLF